MTNLQKRRLPRPAPRAPNGSPRDGSEPPRPRGGLVPRRGSSHRAIEIFPSTRRARDEDVAARRTLPLRPVTGDIRIGSSRPKGDAARAASASGRRPHPMRTACEPDLLFFFLRHFLAPSPCSGGTVSITRGRITSLRERGCHEQVEAGEKRMAARPTAGGGRLAGAKRRDAPAISSTARPRSRTSPATP